MQPKGYIIFGPKETAHVSPNAQIFYTPTPEQIRNIREMFGWDFVTEEEMEELLRP